MFQCASINVYVYVYMCIVCIKVLHIHICVWYRTFHTPVLTPWELELGLGVRPWNSVFKTHSGMYHIYTHIITLNIYRMYTIVYV